MVTAVGGGLRGGVELTRNTEVLLAHLLGELIVVHLR